MGEETHIGFTGTAASMTPEQRRTLAIVLRKYSGWFHHGDCVGADEQAHNLVAGELSHQYRIIIHPPENPRKRAWCKTEPGWLMIERPYLFRNKCIVQQCQRLVATPREASEQQRGGTWLTVRYARSLGKPIKIILPNGRVRNERW